MKEVCNLKPTQRESVLQRMETLDRNLISLAKLAKTQIAVEQKQKEFKEKANTLLQERTVTIVIPGKELQISSEEFKKLSRKEVFLLCPTMDKFVLVSKSWFNWWALNFKLLEGTVVSCTHSWNKVINPRDSRELQALNGIDYENLGFKKEGHWPGIFFLAPHDFDYYPFRWLDDPDYD